MWLIYYAMPSAYFAMRSLRSVAFYWPGKSIHVVILLLLGAKARSSRRSLGMLAVADVVLGWFRAGPTEESLNDIAVWLIVSAFAVLFLLIALNVQTYGKVAVRHPGAAGFR